MISGAPATAGTSRYYRMTPFEVATGWLTGEDPGSRAGSPQQERLRPLDVLGSLLAPALQRSPCVVAFSGGRDSSAVLAAASEVALRNGLPPPIAATLRYPGDPDADEQHWQERVIRHLGIADWEKIPAGVSGDLLGPVAADSLRRRGLLWPPAHHTAIPLLRAAMGGSLVTGDGGDEVFGDRRVTSLVRALSGRLPRNRAEFSEAVLAAAPRRTRRRMYARSLRMQLSRSWLLPAAQEGFARALATDRAAEPLAWAASIRRLGRMRAWRAGLHNQDLVAAEEGTKMLRPLQDPRFIDALCRHASLWGFPDRGAAMRSVFSPVLPDDVLTRNTKALFNRAVFGPRSREFVARWTGEGVPDGLVDPEVLLRFWQAEVPHALSFALLQSAWLADDAQRFRTEAYQAAGAPVHTPR